MLIKEIVEDINVCKLKPNSNSCSKWFYRKEFIGVKSGERGYHIALKIKNKYYYIWQRLGSTYRITLIPTPKFQT